MSISTRSAAQPLASFNLDEPPFIGGGSQANVVFAVDSEAARKLLPPQFELAVDTFGKTPLIVTANRYDTNFSVGSGHAGPHYDEMGFALPVKYKTPDGRTVLGAHFFDLRLNAQMPTDVGVQTYGFAKTLATVDVTDTARSTDWNVRAKDGSLVGAMSLMKPTLFDRLSTSLLGVAASLGFDAVSFVTGGVPVLLNRGGQTVLAKIDATTDSIVPIRVQDARFPRLEKAGLLRAGQKPVTAFMMNGLYGTLSPPLTP